MGAILEQFDRETREGKYPEIEFYLRECAGVDSEKLYGHLLAAELEWRAKGGERPTIAEYRRRFPQFRDVTDREFPDKFDKYEVVELRGIGGFGRVYRARLATSKKSFAIKALGPGRELTASEGFARFRQEFDVLKNLNHFNIVKGHFAEIDEEGNPYLVMDYIEGKSLQEMLNPHQPLRVRRAIDLARETAAGLVEAHSKGVVHRDLKPANILVDDKDHAHITDFGLALLTSERYSTTGKVFAGTWPYMSPEAIRGETLDPRTDIWSLGVVLYQMLTGVLPFGGSQDEGLFHRIQAEQPTPPHVLNPKVPGQVEQICLRCLEKDRSRRWETAHDLEPALRRNTASASRRRAAAYVAAGAMLAAGAAAWLRAPLASGASERLLERGESLAVSGNFGAAITKYREATWLNPDNESARVQLALALERNGDMSGALQNMQEAVRLRPNDAKAHETLGLLYGYGGLYGQEAAEERAALQIDPRLEVAHQGLAGALAREGEIGQAMMQERAALRLNPGDAVAHRDSALILEEQGDWSTAEKEAKEALRLNPLDALAHLLLGASMERSGDRQGALEEYATALKLDPKSPEARQDYERVSGKLNGESTPSVSMSTSTLSSPGEIRRSPTAPPTPKPAPPVASDASERALERGESFAASGEWQSAATQYREAILLDPSSEGAYLLLALALEKQGDAAQALQNVQEAVRLKPNDAKAHAALGLLYGDQGLWDKEVGEERAAIQINPDLEGAHVSLGVALGHEGDNAQAELQERLAIHLDSGDALAHRNLAALLVQEGDWNEAGKEAKEAVHLNPSDAPAHVLFGMNLERKGDRRHALEEYATALKLDPTNRQARENYRRLSVELKK